MIEEVAERREGEAAGDLDHVCGFAPQAALLQAEVEHAHFGVTVMAGLRIPVAVEADEFRHLVQWILGVGDGFQAVERVAGVFDEEDAAGARVRIVEPETERLLVVQEPYGGVSAVDAIVTGAGIDACRHHQQVLV